MSTTIPVLRSDTQVNIPGVGMRDAKCLAGGYVFQCRVPSLAPVPKFSEAYKPTKGIHISTMVTGPDGWHDLVHIGPQQRNAAIAQWWLDNCFPTIRRVLDGITDAEVDVANAFGWWLSTDPRFIQVTGWERNVWRDFAVDILNDVKENNVTFRQAAGIDRNRRAERRNARTSAKTAATWDAAIERDADGPDAEIYAAMAAGGPRKYRVGGMDLNASEFTLIMKEHLQAKKAGRTSGMQVEKTVVISEHGA